MRLVILPLLCILPAYATETFAQKNYCHSSAQTLESSKIDYKQYVIQHFRLKSWIPVSSTGMTLTHSPVLFQDGIRKKKAALVTESDRKLSFISSDIKSSFFDAGGLAPNTMMKLINVYKEFGIGFKKDIVPKGKLEVLFEKSLGNQKAEEKILYTSLTTNNKAISL